jgi:putative transposase
VKSVYPNVLRLANSQAEGLAHLDELCRTKIAELVQAYLESEVDELIQRKRYERIAQGSHPIYRNGHDPERRITTGAGAIAIRRPRLRGATYESAVIPKHQRRLPSLDRTFHQLWLEGLSQRDFEPALRALLGAEAPLSASAIARVNTQFRGEFDAWRARRLDHEHYVYLWADGVHLGAGPGDERRVILVIVGADSQGEKHLVTLDEAMSESELSLEGHLARSQAARVACGATRHCRWGERLLVGALGRVSRYAPTTVLVA